MIEELSIRDLGVIAEATLPVGPGFTAVTGETGAGKTMVVSALGLLLGSRADAGTVRQGAERAWVEGRWLVADDGSVAARARDAGGDVDDGELLLGRSVSAEGRSRAVVGGRSAPVGVLADLGESLVVVHGQSDQVRLRSAVAQRDALDRFAGETLQPVLAEYREAFHRWREAAAEHAALVAAHEERAREAEELRAAMDEIAAAEPVAGESRELAERADRLTNLEELRLAGEQAREMLSSDAVDDVPDAVVLVDGARRALERVAEHDAQLAPIAEALASAGFILSDAVADLSGYLAGLDADGSRELELIQERRALLTDLERRFGPTLDDVIAYADRGGLRLLELDGDDERIEQLAEQVDADAARVDELAARISGIRREAGAELAERVTAELAALAMPDARLEVQVDDSGELAAHGRDSVAILLAPHQGAPARPVSKGASGGELSRVMLAIEVVIAATDPVPTFVFDEVDAGVGGAAAIEIGRRLARLAENSQVIVVTHLAQVAAFATNHLRVAKGSDGRVTASSVQQLHDEERAAEMARLLSGLADSDSGLAHARELLALAHTADRMEARGGY
ncbi:DNA repair protein RecN [Agromyces rhizosphaerae]|uniref:DNA repair protein RecN n=1 Tax=Agromyces rhizosphaerae TaxID=88374 RepID=A0A9W6CZK5_9MICO|nr:DNA repair protein RecN [Agromyces rhizosphaerae]GLI29155.1 DNA repair protein RecN [Agromyces rhizosphaerae]